MSAPTETPSAAPEGHDGPEGEPVIQPEETVLEETADSIKQPSLHPRRSVLLALGIGTGATLASVAGFNIFKPHPTEQAEQQPPVDNPQTSSPSPKPVEGASAGPEIPKGALSFDAAMSQFEGLTTAQVQATVEAQDYTTSAQIMTALFINAAQNQESFVDASAGCEVASPIYKKNPVFNDMSDATAPDLLATALSPQVLAAAQSKKGRTTGEFDPLDVEKALKVMELTWGLSAHDSVLLKNDKDLVEQRLQRPGSSGRMDVSAIDFKGLFAKATFFKGNAKTATFGEHTYPVRYIQYYASRIDSYVVATIADVPVEKAVYGIPAPGNFAGYKETVLKTNSEGKPIYDNGKQVVIPTLIAVTFAGIAGQ